MTRIITYSTTDPEAPASMRAAAAMVPTGPGTHWLSTGATEEEARGKLLAMRDAQEPRKPRPKAKADAPSPVSDYEDPGDVI